NMANPEREDEPVERNLAALVDCRKQIADRGLAIAFLFEQFLLVLLFQPKDVGRLFHPFLFEEEFDLFFAQSLDIEGTARCEQFEVLDLLIGASKLTGAAGASSLLGGRRFLAHHIGVQVTWAFLRK